MRLTASLSLLAILATLGCAGVTNNSDGSSPVVSIDAPVANATVAGQVAIDMTVTDDFGVDKVTVLVDGVVLATLFNPPFHANWNTQPLTSPSTHTIRVEALDVAKNLGVRQIQVTVQNGHQAPPATPR